MEHIFNIIQKQSANMEKSYCSAFTFNVDDFTHSHRQTYLLTNNSILLHRIFSSRARCSIYHFFCVHFVIFVFIWKYPRIFKQQNGKQFRLKQTHKSSVQTMELHRSERSKKEIKHLDRIKRKQSTLPTQCHPVNRWKVLEFYYGICERERHTEKKHG